MKHLSEKEQEGGETLFVFLLPHSPNPQGAALDTRHFFSFQCQGGATALGAPCPKETL